MKKRTPLMLLIIVLLSLRASAQTYSLQDCIQAALANDQQLKNSLLDVKSADYRIKEVKSSLLPNIDMNGQSMYYKDLPSQYAPASAFGGPDGEYTKMSLNMRQTITGNIQVTQNLYNQSVFTGLKAAKVVQEASELQVNVTRENIIYNVSATYYSIQVLNDNLARLEENIANLEKTVSINQVLKDNELVSENVHNRMLINLENLRNQYENQKLVQDKNVTLLKYLMNVDLNEKVEVAPFDYLEVISMPEPGDVNQRTDIQLQQAQIKLSQYDKKTVVAGYYPVLANTFSYGYTSYYDEFSPFRQINNDWIKSSYIALSLKIPVFDGFRKQNQIRQKDIAIQKNINALSMMRSNANKEAQDAAYNYVTNKNLLVSNEKTLKLAEQLFTSSQAEYANGITSTTELLNAQNDLSSARTNYSAALLNLKLAELSWKKANGSLLNN